MTVPATERRGRTSRLQRMSAVTSVAAVGVSALAFTAAPGQADGAQRVSEGELPIHPVAFRAAADGPAEQKAGIDAQTSRAGDRARDGARSRARKKAVRQAAERAAEQRAEVAERAARHARKVRRQAVRERAEEQPASRSGHRHHRTATTTASHHGSTGSAPAGSPRETARRIIGDEAQFQCFSRIVEHESGWNIHAQNPSGAYGLVQALPGSKMSSAGPDWRNSAGTQIRWGLNYMQKRYGGPCGAWSFWQSNNWY